MTHSDTVNLLVSIGNNGVQLLSDYIFLVLLQKIAHSGADMINNHPKIYQSLGFNSCHCFIIYFSFKTVFILNKIACVYVSDNCLNRKWFRLEILSNFKVNLLHSLWCFFQQLLRVILETRWKCQKCQIKSSSFEAQKWLLICFNGLAIKDIQFEHFFHSFDPFFLN